MNKFVVVYNDDTLRAATESMVSKMFDLADCNAMEEVRAVYGIDATGKLVPVTVGPIVRERHTADDTIYYGSSPIKAGYRVVGYVHHSDH